MIEYPEERKIKHQEGILRRSMMLNPGYGVKARDNETELGENAGPLFRCPSCKRKLLNSVAQRIKIRCKCGKWIYIYKKN